MARLPVVPVGARTVNAFVELTGCELPIQLAAMSGIASPELAIAVSDAGGLGMIAVGSRTLSQMTPQVDAVLAGTDRPVGVGFVVEFLDRDTVVALAERLPILEFFWGWPDRSLVDGCAGRVVGWQVGAVDEARAAAEAGCRYVIAQGAEAGGHLRGTVPSRELVPAIAAAVGDDVAVVAAGGIATGDDVRVAFDLGADAVRVGSRFVATVESAAHDRYVDLLIDAGDDATTVTTAFDVGWPDAPHRVLRSAVEAAGATEDVIVGDMPAADGSRRQVPRRFVSPPTRAFTGRIDAMALYAGCHLAPITARVSAREVIAELATGWRDRRG